MDGASRVRGRLLVGVLIIAALGGCNPLTAIWYLVGAPEEKFAPEVALTPPKGKKEAKVVVLISCAPGLSPEFIGIDRMLASEFNRALSAAVQANKEKVTLVPTAQVEAYKADHPNWTAKAPADIGRQFEADYLIDLEIVGISLYEDERSRHLLRGRTVIEVSAYDLTKPNDEPRKSRYETEFPRTGPVDAFDKTTLKFRETFIKRVAMDLTWKFTAHEFRDHFPVD